MALLPSGEERKAKEAPCPLDSLLGQAGRGTAAALSVCGSPPPLLPDFLPGVVLLSPRPLHPPVHAALLSIYRPPPAASGGAGALFALWEEGIVSAPASAFASCWLCLPQGRTWIQRVQLCPCHVWFVTQLEADGGPSRFCRHFLKDGLSSSRALFFCNFGRWLLGALAQGSAFRHPECDHFVFKDDCSGDLQLHLEPS